MAKIGDNGGGVTPHDAPHDVFISYAREDSEWVRTHLYEPLRRCRTADGRPPRVFFDVGEHGVQVGQDFLTAIESAIERVLKFVPVYSDRYFEKEMCFHELRLARTRDPLFDKQFLLPVLIDDHGAEKVPFSFRPLHYLRHGDSEWFGKLCQSLGLRPSQEELALAFLDQPEDAFANHTLPPIRISAQSNGSVVQYDEQITLRAERGQLLGTTTVKLQGGLATFAGLSIANWSGTTCLVASCPTLGETASRSFNVVSRPIFASASANTCGGGESQVLNVSGEVVFFAGGRHLAVFRDDSVRTFSLDGRPLMPEPMAVHAPLRLVRRRNEDLVAADWEGNVYLVSTDGTCREWRFGQGAAGFIVPADVDLTEGQIHVAFWNGSIFRLDRTGAAEALAHDPAGVQAIGVHGDRIFTCDFAGNLRVYRNGRLVNTNAIEPVIWLLRETRNCLVAVGDRKFYHISPDGSRVIDFELPLAEVLAVYELSDQPVVMDVAGKAIRFNEELVVRSVHHAQAGAVPSSADDRGESVIFRHRDGTRTLSLGERVVFSHTGGCLAVNPQGDMFALGAEDSLRLYSRPAFMDLIRRQELAVRPASGGSVVPTA